MQEAPEQSFVRCKLHKNGILDETILLYDWIEQF